MAEPPVIPQDSDSPKGFAFAVSAYVLWGFLPLYMKAMSHIPAVEIVAHRVLWSVPVAGLVLWWLGRTADLRTALRSPSMLRMAAVTAALISVNWAIYVWAIAADHALDAALGYYINPLVSVALGAIVLKERLSKPQLFAIGLAVVAVAILTIGGGRLPVVALALAGTFAAYGYLKKSLPVGPNQGFMLEVLILLPFALGWLLWLALTGKGHFTETPWTTMMMIAAGPITAAPLMLYANGAKLLRLSTIGILQYIAPTLIFLTAVFVFGEPFPAERLIAFALIWAALVIYTLGMLRRA